jgi:hypothetical protein
LNLKKQEMKNIDLNKEMAWVTFLADGWQTKWFPVLCPITGRQLEWSDSNKIMNHCRSQFNNENNWVSFGIAPTSQMMFQNSVRDNL